jgi:uncharacterized protein (TIGR04141 family)
MSKAKSLNIRLLREGLAIANAFTESFAPGAGRALERRPWNDIEGASLFIGQIYSNPPGWRPFLEGGSPSLPAALFTAGAGAVIFLPAADRIIAVCFGHVHIALNDDAFERQFGLKVTLNTVPRGQLRSLDLATPDAVTFQKRIQASKDSDLLEFGVDMLRDLARVAGGTPGNQDFAHFVAGKDSVSITCDVEVSTLQEKCREVLAAFRLSTYQKEPIVLRRNTASCNMKGMKVSGGDAWVVVDTTTDLPAIVEGIASRRWTELEEIGRQIDRAQQDVD